jgi:hypothetical protein
VFHKVGGGTWWEVKVLALVPGVELAEGVPNGRHLEMLLTIRCTLYLV